VSIHFTNASSKKHISLNFVDLFQVNGNVINSIHCADCHGRARQVKTVTSVLYYFTLSLYSHVRLFDHQFQNSQFFLYAYRMQ
jgi:hypothetical protein